MERLHLIVLVSLTLTTFLLVNSKKQVLTMEFYALECPVTKGQVCVPMECNLKPIKRGISVINLTCNLTQTVEQIYLTIKIYQKTATSMRYILDRTENVCQASSKKNGPILKLVEPYFLKYTNIDFKCPMKPILIQATNVSAQVDSLPPYFPEGNFRVELLLSGPDKMIGLQVKLKIKIGHRFID